MQGEQALGRDLHLPAARRKFHVKVRGEALGLCKTNSLNSSQLNKPYFDFVLWHNRRFPPQAPEGKCVQVPSVLLGRLRAGAGGCSQGAVGLSVPSKEGKGTALLHLKGALRPCGLEKGLEEEQHPQIELSRQL